MSNPTLYPYERWIIKADTWFERKDNEGVGDNGEPFNFPYVTCNGFSLVGFHVRTHEKLHEYCGFVTLQELERFAREHHIKLDLVEV